MLKFDEVFTEQKLIEAAKRVKKKKGCGGIDGMDVIEGYKFFKKKQNREVVIKKLKRGNYIIHKNRTVMIPKDNNKKRILSIQSVVDRIVLDCLNYELQKKYIKLFSSSTFAYVAGRGAHDAIEAVNDYYNYENYRYALKIDLLKYFDKIPHNLLLKQLEGLVDERILKIIRLFLKSNKSKGVPQGNPISPFLSNLFLIEFDHWMDEKIEFRYLRYADDILILSKEPVKEILLLEIEEKLSEIRIKVNKDKVEVGGLEEIEYLGFIKTKIGFTVSEKRITKFFNNIEILKVIADKKAATIALNDYIIGWMAFYHPANIHDIIKSTYSELIELFPEIRNYPEILLKIQLEKHVCI